MELSFDSDPACVVVGRRRHPRSVGVVRLLVQVPDEPAQEFAPDSVTLARLEQPRGEVAVSDLILRIAKDIEEVERPSLPSFVIAPELRGIDESLQLLFHCSFCNRGRIWTRLTRRPAPRHAPGLRPHWKPRGSWSPAAQCSNDLLRRTDTPCPRGRPGLGNRVVKGLALAGVHAVAFIVEDEIQHRPFRQGARLVQMQPPALDPGLQRVNLIGDIHPTPSSSPPARARAPPSAPRRGRRDPPWR